MRTTPTSPPCSAGAMVTGLVGYSPQLHSEFGAAPVHLGARVPGGPQGEPCRPGETISQIPPNTETAAICGVG
jgi:hypothetical protein